MSDLWAHLQRLRERRREIAYELEMLNQAIAGMEGYLGTAPSPQETICAVHVKRDVFTWLTDSGVVIGEEPRL